MILDFSHHCKTNEEHCFIEKLEGYIFLSQKNIFTPQMFFSSWFCFEYLFCSHTNSLKLPIFFTQNFQILNLTKKLNFILNRCSNTIIHCYQILNNNPSLCCIEDFIRNFITLQYFYYFFLFTMLFFFEKNLFSVSWPIITTIFSNKLYYN